MIRSQEWKLTGSFQLKCFFGLIFGLILTINGSETCWDTLHLVQGGKSMLHRIILRSIIMLISVSFFSLHFMIHLLINFLKIDCSVVLLDLMICTESDILHSTIFNFVVDGCVHVCLHLHGILMADPYTNMKLIIIKL